METRHDLAVQKTSASKVEAEARKTPHMKHSQKTGSPASHAALPREQAQVQHALNVIQSSPEVRAGKINALRAQIEAGTYHIDSKSLAMKLLGLTEQDAV